MYMPSMYMPRRHRHSDWDDDITSYYYIRLVEVSDEEEEDDQPRRSLNNRRRHHLILEIESSDDDDDEEDDDEEPWEEDPYSLCIYELPLRPMSRFCKAFIDVVFVVAAILTEGGLVWMALRDDDTCWFISLLTMLPLMIVLLYLLDSMHLMVTRDLEAGSRPKPSLPDENV